MLAKTEIEKQTSHTNRLVTIQLNLHKMENIYQNAIVFNWTSSIGVELTFLSKFHSKFRSFMSWLMSSSSRCKRRSNTKQFEVK